MSLPNPPNITQGQMALDPINGVVYYKDENNNLISTTWSWLQDNETQIRTEDNVTISSNLTVGGDLVISGNTVSLNVAEILIEDNILVLNSNVTGSPILNGGIEIERGTSTNVQIRWNEALDKWQFTNDGTTYLDLSSIVENSVTLGLHTVGDYVKNLVAGNGITISNNSGEGATPNLQINTSVVQTRVANITDTEIGYLDGVTSAIQTQINTKAPTASPTFTGTVGIPMPNFGYTTTATAAGTTTLVNTSNYTQFFTGTTTQTITLPVASTMVLGQGFVIHNNSTGNVTVNSSGGNLVATLIANSTIGVTCILASGTTAASWDADYTGFTTITGTGNNVLAVSPTFTGTPAAPTAAVDTNTTQIATTAYVVGQGYAKSKLTTNAQIASYTLILADKDKLVEINNASANTLTVPPNASVAFPVGTQITVIQTGAGATTITPGAAVTINATPGLVLRAQWSWVTLIKRATDTWIALGDLKA